MGTSPRPALPGVAEGRRPGLAGAVGLRRRRPSGEPPPLPYHLQLSGVGWLVAAAVLVTLTVVVFAGGLRGPAIGVAVADAAVVRWLGGLHGPGLVGLERALAGISSWWVLDGLALGLVLALLGFRRFRHLIIWLIVANLLPIIAVDVLGALSRRPRPLGVGIRAGWGGWALPSVQVAILAVVLMAVLYTLVPEGRWRNAGKWVAAALVTLAALGRVALGADAPTDVLVGAALGVTIPLVTFRVFTPNEAFPIRYRRGRAAHLDIGGRRGAAIRQAVEDQLGLVVVDITPFGQQFSASCTPLRITVEGGPATHLFAKLCARSHLRADRWYKLGRELLYGRLEDEISFKSVRRLVEHEDYELRMLRDFGLPVPKPYGTVELTPEREYLLVTEFLENAREISDVEIDDAIIDEALAIIRRLWDVGLAHRDIKPANLLVQDGHVRLIDAFLTEAHPSPWRQAIDLANMLLVLGLLTDPVRVYGRARLVFAEAEIAEAFAAEQGGAMPAQIRQMLRASPTDVRKEFTGLLPERPRAIALQRWTARRIGLLTLALALVGLIGMNLGNAFSNDLAVRTRLSGTRLACTEFESLVVQAQAVPSAAQVPCVRSLPVGWSLTEVAVNDGRAMITLGHDRGGMGALVARFTAGCDPAGSTEVASGTPGVRRFGLAQTLPGRSTAVWYDRLPGGCVTYTLRARADVQAGLADEASTMIGFTSRQVLGQTLERRSGGRLHLDPRAAG